MTTPILTLPTTHEATRTALSSEKADYHARLAQFVQPVEDTERHIVEILSRLQPDVGRAVLLLGTPGAGKSTFIESMAWRKHLGLARLASIDCSELDPQNRLTQLISLLQRHCATARESKGRTAIAIDYLETLGGLDTQTFFQTLNGLLRKSPVLVIWPVTKQEDARDMLSKALNVSGTIFDKDLPILSFKGPDLVHFSGIATNAIGVFNEGRMLQEFMLTPTDLDFVRDDLCTDPNATVTIREYLERIYKYWSKSSGHLSAMLGKMPRPNEVWIVFCHPNAENIVGQFANKGNHPESAWKAYHAKLWEYIPNTKRIGRWKNPTRLQYAIEGVFTCRILHASPQSVISAAVAYGAPVLAAAGMTVPEAWQRKETARRHLMTTALFRQLKGEEPARGKTTGGPAASAREDAKVPFAQLNQFLAGSGHDQHVNHAIAAVLRDTLPTDFKVYAETAHPWLPSTEPDIRVDTPDNRQICIEFCYTNKQDDTWRIPDYALNKLADYMDAVDTFVTPD